MSETKRRTFRRWQCPECGLEFYMLEWTGPVDPCCPACTTAAQPVANYRRQAAAIADEFDRRDDPTGIGRAIEMGIIGYALFGFCVVALMFVVGLAATIRF